MSKKYDPKIKYEWQPETKFELTGNEFGLILNTFRTILSSQQAQDILLLNNSNNTMDAILARNVENGIVKPAATTEEITENNLKPMQVVKEDKK